MKEEASDRGKKGTTCGRQKHYEKQYPREREKEPRETRTTRTGELRIWGETVTKLQETLREREANRFLGD